MSTAESINIISCLHLERKTELQDEQFSSTTEAAKQRGASERKQAEAGRFGRHFARGQRGWGSGGIGGRVHLVDEVFVGSRRRGGVDLEVFFEQAAGDHIRRVGARGERTR